MLILTSLTASCGTGVSDAGCKVYAEHSTGIIGADAPETPDGVKRRIIVLDDAMISACR